MTGADRSVWHIDAQANALVRSAVDDAPELLEWGERPFGSNTTAIAHDGTQLWVLDSKGKRICKIEKGRTEQNDETMTTARP
jgi:sugar lactone lactonase YvrE